MAAISKNETLKNENAKNIEDIFFVLFPQILIVFYLSYHLYKQTQIYDKCIFYEVGP